MIHAIPINIISIATSFSNRNGYSVVMKEISGSRKLQMIVGTAEAQAIVICLEKIITTRPMTHHFLSNILSDFGVVLKNVIIEKYEDGVYFSNAVFEDAFGNIKSIDCRPSDAICLALKMEKPILVEESIFELSNEKFVTSVDSPNTSKSNEDSIDKLPLAQLKTMLEQAIEAENFETAAAIQQEINKRTP